MSSCDRTGQVCVCVCVCVKCVCVCVISVTEGNNSAFTAEEAVNSGVGTCILLSYNMHKNVCKTCKTLTVMNALKCRTLAREMSL